MTWVLFSSPVRNFSTNLFLFYIDADYGVAWMYETGENDFDQPFHHVFERNGQIGMLSGMTSYHDGYYEDRRFKYKIFKILKCLILKPKYIFIYIFASWYPLPAICWHP